MSLWFFTPYPTYYFVPAPVVYDVSPPEPAIEDSVDKIESKKEEDCAVVLNISRQDLERAGYNHKRSNWTEQEDRKLLQLAKTQHLNWSQIGKKMDNRNSKMCYSRYRRLCYETKKRWTSQQEATILQAIERLGFEWKVIAKLVSGRTPRQIEQHYHFCLRPDINKSEWTLQEDLMLVELLGTYGTNWKKLQESIKGRSQNQIKNRYFGRLLKISAWKQKPKKLEQEKIKIQC